MGNTPSDNGSGVDTGVMPPMLPQRAWNQTPADSTSTRELCAALQRFYEQHNPANANQIDAIVAKFAGHPNVLEMELRKKYGASLHDYYTAAGTREERQSDSSGDENDHDNAPVLLLGEEAHSLPHATDTPCALEAKSLSSEADGQGGLNEEVANVASSKLEESRRRARPSSNDSTDAKGAQEIALRSPALAGEELTLIDPEQEEVAALSRRVALLKLRARHHAMGKELALVQTALKDNNPEVLQQASSMLSLAAAPADDARQSVDDSNRPTTPSRAMSSS